MNPTHRILTHAGRVLLSAALIAGLTLTAPPPPARAAISFTDLGTLGMVQTQMGDAAWGDYDGDLDVLVAGGAAGEDAANREKAGKGRAGGRSACQSAVLATHARPVPARRPC